MMEMTPPSERQSSKPPGSRDSKGDSSEKQALGTLGLYLKNRVVPPTTPPQTFWPNFMPISREYCNSCLIADPNVHKLHLFFLCGSTVDCSWLEKKIKSLLMTKGNKMEKHKA